MANLIIAIIVFPVGVFCGIALMACFIVAKRADSNPPDNYCGEEPISNKSNNPDHMDNGGFEGFM